MSGGIEVWAGWPCRTGVSLVLVTVGAKKILQDALALPEDERLMLAEELLHSVDVEDDGGRTEVDEAWRAELVRRVEQVRNGEVELVSWEAVRAQGREILAQRR